MSDKLDTWHKVWAWALEMKELPYGPGPDDTATAERLALAMRVLAIVERDLAAARARNMGPYSSDRIVENFSTRVLAEAAQKEGK